jgi:carbon-monoxide dehydrogenase medium subunit
MLNVAVVVSIVERSFLWARIALGPVAPTPYLATRAQESLAGSPVSEASIGRAAQMASEDAQPRSSVLRGTREYRKEMVRVYVRRALEQAAGLA